MTKLAGSFLVGVVICGALAVFAQSTFPVRFDDSPAEVELAPAGSIDAIELEAIRWRSRDTQPFACDADHVGFVYLQRDVPNFTGPSHELCICRATDLGGPPTYLWQGLTGSVSCAELD